MFLTLMHVALTSCCENSWSRAFFSDSPNVSQVAHKAINVYLSRLQKKAGVKIPVVKNSWTRAKIKWRKEEVSFTHSFLNSLFCWSVTPMHYVNRVKEWRIWKKRKHTEKVKNDDLGGSLNCTKWVVYCVEWAKLNSENELIWRI